MNRQRLLVTYEGGAQTEVAIGFVHLVAWEAYARRHSIPSDPALNQATSTAVAVHAALGIQEGFEVWWRSVEDIEPAGEEAVDPTPEEVLTG
jgi:hypothetical protein